MLWELSVVEQRSTAIQEVLGGMPVTEVADRYGVSRQSVHTWLRRYQAGDLAQGYGQWCKDHEAVEVLLQAERLAPPGSPLSACRPTTGGGAAAT